MSPTGSTVSAVISALACTPAHTTCAPEGNDDSSPSRDKVGQRSASVQPAGDAPSDADQEASEVMRGSTPAAEPADSHAAAASTPQRPPAPEGALQTPQGLASASAFSVFMSPLVRGPGELSFAATPCKSHESQSPGCKTNRQTPNLDSCAVQAGVHQSAACMPSKSMQVMQHVTDNSGKLLSDRPAGVPGHSFYWGVYMQSSGT